MESENNDELEPARAKVRWDNDFGPQKPLWIRYVMAAGALTFVIGFLAMAILMGQERAAARNATQSEPWSWPVLLGLFALVILIAVKGEHWAIRVRHFFEGRPPPQDLD